MSAVDDVKFTIDDELEAILFLVRRLEGDVKDKVGNRKHQRRLMKSLLKLEKGVISAKIELGK